jgi:tetratricopeptide (TPR) repeat protein
VQDATLRALEDNPEFAADLPDAQVKRLKAEAAKERGNDAFKAKDYSVARQHYSEAIKLDNTNSTYYSNRCSPPTTFQIRGDVGAFLAVIQYHARSCTENWVVIVYYVLNPLPCETEAKQGPSCTYKVHWPQHPKVGRKDQCNVTLSFKTSALARIVHSCCCTGSLRHMLTFMMCLLDAHGVHLHSDGAC